MAHLMVLFAIRLLRRTVEYDSSPHCSKSHDAYHLYGLATKTGEICGLVPVRKRHFFEISSSICGFACAECPGTPLHKPLISSTFTKNCSFSPREPRCPHPEFLDGNRLAGGVGPGRNPVEKKGAAETAAPMRKPSHCGGLVLPSSDAPTEQESGLGHSYFASNEPSQSTMA